METLQEAYNRGLEAAVKAIAAQSFHLVDKEQVDLVMTVRARYISAIKAEKLETGTVL